MLFVAKLDVSRYLIPELFGKSKVDHVDFVRVITVTNKKVIGLNVTVNEVKVVGALHQIDQLMQQHTASLDAESSVANFEKILQARTK
jgi:hypothetical protein